MVSILYNIKIWTKGKTAPHKVHDLIRFNRGIVYYLIPTYQACTLSLFFWLLVGSWAMIILGI